MFLLLTVGSVTKVTQTQRQIQPYQTTMTTTILPPWLVNCMCLRSHQASSCPRLPRWGSLPDLS